MTNYTLRFQETYESFFDVEAESFEEAKAKLDYDIGEGNVKMNKQCLHSNIYYVPEFESPEQAEYRVLADMVDDLDEDQANFVLWLLLSRYSEMCEKEIKETPNTNTKQEYALITMLKEHRRVAKQMRDVLEMNLW